MAVSDEDFIRYKFASKMGPQLRQVVEQQLRADLLQYGLAAADLQFDWSGSCLEGSYADWLDGTIENFSGIALRNQQGELVAEGCMEFVLADDLLLVYWDDLTSWDAAGEHALKSKFGIPPHIWSRILPPNQSTHAAYQMRNPPFAAIS